MVWWYLGMVDVFSTVRARPTWVMATKFMVVYGVRQENSWLLFQTIPSCDLPLALFFAYALASIDGLLCSCSDFYSCCRWFLTSFCVLVLTSWDFFSHVHGRPHGPGIFSWYHGNRPWCRSTVDVRRERVIASGVNFIKDEEMNRISNLENRLVLCLGPLNKSSTDRFAVTTVVVASVRHV